MPVNTLKITDGTTTINLLSENSGWLLKAWEPTIASQKESWQESPLTSGRQIAFKRFNNAIEVFVLNLEQGSQDEAARTLRGLEVLLQQAVNYWVNEDIESPVWLEVQTECSTYAQYAIIHTYQMPNLKEIFAQPFWTTGETVGMDDLELTIERGHWLETTPTESIATFAYATEDYDGRSLGNVDSTGTKEPTIGDVFVSNKRTTANLTDVYVDDGGVFGANLMDAALPFSLLPAAPAINDAVYFGIDTSVDDSGPFDNLVFDIGTAGAGYTGVWEYYDGVWTAVGFSPQDNTNAGGLVTGIAFDTTGIGSVHFIRPPTWIAVAVNGVTAYWVRYRVTGIPGALAAPTQQNRDIYTSAWPYIRVDKLASGDTDDEIGGEIRALLRMVARNYSSFVAGAPPSFSTFDVSRVIFGLRSRPRGNSFTSHLNLADEQNPAGVTVTPSGGLAFANGVVPGIELTPTGRMITGTGGIITVDLGAAIADQYLGRFRAFVRGMQSAVADVTFKLDTQFGKYQLLSSSGTITSTFGVAWPFVVDLGEVAIPNLYNETINNLRFEITASSGGAATLYFYDLILIPMDEMGGEFYQAEPVTPSGAAASWQDALFLGRSTLTDFDFIYLDADQFSYPRNGLMPLLLDGEQSDGLVGFWTDGLNDEFALQRSIAQKLYMLQLQFRGSTGEPATGAISNTNLGIRLFSQQRYLTLRGDDA